MSTLLSSRTSQSQIPNLWGNYYLIRNGVAYGAHGDGAFYTSESSSTYGANQDTAQHSTKLHFNANSLNSRYGDYAEVNPLYESCVFCIRY